MFTDRVSCAVNLMKAPVAPLEITTKYFIYRNCFSVFIMMNTYTERERERETSDFQIFTLL